MSGFDLKEVGENGSEPTLASPVSSILKTKPDGAKAREATEILSSRFDFLELVSVCGGVASYLVRDLRANADEPLVLLKLCDSRGGDSRLLELFRLEASAAANLSHRNIIRSKPSEEIDGIHFSISEHHSDVETLKNLLERHGWLDLKLAIGIVHQISDALEYAHALGVLHLRVHPENILLDRDGTALLADFGIEANRELAWAHEERSSRCPIHYVSPEQGSGKVLDGRSDLYSLGVVLYQMLTDRLPVNSEDVDAVRKKQLTQAPLAPHLYFPDIPLALSAVISCMLEKDPARRFPEVPSFQVALDKSLSQEARAFVETGNNAPRIEENETIEEIDWEDKTDPIDLETLGQAQPRHKWECPSITVIEPPATEIPAESQFEKTRTLEQGSAEPRLSRHRIAPIPGKELRRQSALSTQMGPMILVLVLGAAAIIGLIGLAFADRMRIPNEVPPRSPVKEDNASVPPVLPTEEKAPVINQQQTADLQKPANSASVPNGVLPDGATTSPASPVRDTRRRIMKPSTSQRQRQVRRKSRRAARYWGDYRPPVRRYYRSGER